MLDNQQQSATVSQDSGQTQSGPPSDQLGKFVSVVLADTEDAWHDIFRQMGREYEEPKLVLFTGQTRSGCGFASSASGPFYCPEDRRVYIDLSFYRELQQRFGAPGEFAEAYVIAHEVGHHVQNLLGISQKLEQARGRVSKTEFNQLSVRLELQADFLAGVWARYADRTKHIVENGDVDSALRLPAPLVTTGCNARPRDMLCLIPSPTAPLSSASAGSNAATKPAISARAIRSTRGTCKEVRWRISP